MRFVLGTLISIVVACCGVAHAGLSDTVNTIPQPGARFTAQNQEFDRDEDSDRFHETACREETFVYSGCLGTTAAGLSHTPSACTAYARGYRLTETGSITYLNNATCWVIYDRNVTGDLVSSVTWTRVLGTHYLRYCGAASPTPTLPSGTGFSMRVTTSAGAITAVADLRDFGSCGAGGSSFVCADLTNQSCDLCALTNHCCTATEGQACTETADCCVGLCSGGVCVVPGGTNTVGWCNVLDQGAIPDDGIDDTAAFQKCFNLAVGDPVGSTQDCGATLGVGETIHYNHGGIVYAPRGVYDICNPNEALTFNEGTLFSEGASLLGDGPQATVLRCLTPLGGCSEVSQGPHERTCRSALNIGNGPCSISTQSLSSSSSHGSVFLRGFTLLGPGTIDAGSTRGVRTANTDGIVTYEETDPGMTIAEVEVAGFDLGLVAVEQADVFSSGFWSNFDHIAPSEDGGIFDEITFGFAGRSGFLLSHDEGVSNARFKGKSHDGLPVLFYQPRDVCDLYPSCGGHAITASTVDWVIGSGVGNAAILTDNWMDNDNIAANRCIGLHSPEWCCTGSGTGTCPSHSGTIQDSTIRLIIYNTDVSGGAKFGNVSVPYLPTDYTVFAGELRGRNEFTVRGVVDAPTSPAMDTGTWAFRGSSSVGGTKLISDTPASETLAVLNTGNAARIEACDNLETCATLVPVTLTTTTTAASTTTTTLAAGEWCGNPTVIAAGGGSTAFNTNGKTNEHYPGTVALNGKTTTYGSAKTGADLVFSWTPAATGTARIDNCGTTSCTMGGGVDISVREATCMTLDVTASGQRSEGATIARCTDEGDRTNATFGNATACSPNTAGDGCALNVPVTSGTTYYIRVGSSASHACIGNLVVTPP